ncbi:MAG TPA: hypothetical protein VGK67_28495 [Myxococcales bacterium]|jgi:hypothetical protein
MRPSVLSVIAPLAVLLAGCPTFGEGEGDDAGADASTALTRDGGGAGDGDGGTLLAEGAACTRDLACASKNCECVDFDCTLRMCAGASCLCGYGTSGSCTDPLERGAKDPEDCDSESQGCEGIDHCQ